MRKLFSFSRLKALGLLSILFIALPSYSTLQYQLLQGLDSPIKIGFIVPKIDNTISRTFLKNSLKLLNSTGVLKAFYLSDNAFDLKRKKIRERWKTQSIKYIVQLSTRSKSEGALVVIIKCIKLGKTIAKDQTVVEIVKKITPDAQFLKISRAINDRIYQAIEGQPSLFATPIIFVTQEKIASFAMQYQLKMANADGSNEKTLYTSNEPIFALTASPKGNIIAYTALESGRASIYFYNLTTKQCTRATYFSKIDNSPAFSPNGEQLAFVAEKDKSVNIYLLSLKTGEIKQLTHGYSIDTEPVFAKDGQSLIFTSNRDASPQLYEYRFKTQTVTRLTYEGDFNAHASFTKDGQSIVFMHENVNVFGIAKMNLGTKIMNILTITGNDQSPAVSPNSQMVVYTTTANKHKKVLEMISLNGNIRARLISADGSLQSPAWVFPQKNKIVVLK
jgi:TolB protein